MIYFVLTQTSFWIKKAA